jgi:hypothetical protein
VIVEKLRKLVCPVRPTFFLYHNHATVSTELFFFFCLSFFSFSVSLFVCFRLNGVNFNMPVGRSDAFGGPVYRNPPPGNLPAVEGQRGPLPSPSLWGTSSPPERTGERQVLLEDTSPEDEENQEPVPAAAVRVRPAQFKTSRIRPAVQCSSEEGQCFGFQKDRSQSLISATYLDAPINRCQRLLPSSEGPPNLEHELGASTLSHTATPEASEPDINDKLVSKPSRAKRGKAKAKAPPSSPPKVVKKPSKKSTRKKQEAAAAALTDQVGRMSLAPEQPAEEEDEVSPSSADMVMIY